MHATRSLPPSLHSIYPKLRHKKKKLSVRSAQLKIGTDKGLWIGTAEDSDDEVMPLFRSILFALVSCSPFVLSLRRMVFLPCFPFAPIRSRPTLCRRLRVLRCSQRPRPDSARCQA
jgi:hypothetical protein